MKSLNLALSKIRDIEQNVDDDFLLSPEVQKEEWCTNRDAFVRLSKEWDQAILAHAREKFLLGVMYCGDRYYGVEPIESEGVGTMREQLINNCAVVKAALERAAGEPTLRR